MFLLLSVCNPIKVVQTKFRSGIFEQKDYISLKHYVFRYFLTKIDSRGKLLECYFSLRCTLYWTKTMIISTFSVYYFRLLEFTNNYYRQLQITKSYYRLLQVTTDCYIASISKMRESLFPKKQNILIKRWIWPLLKWWHQNMKRQTPAQHK